MFSLPIPESAPSAALPFADGAQIAVVPLARWLDWVTRNDDSLFVALPMVQRGSVWKAGAVADLWDSLLRGMPVGSFTVSRFQADTTVMVRAIGEKEASVEAIRAGSISLLDGQQRTLAMCIGWPRKREMEMDRKLWVDFGEAGTGGRPFRLRVTTRFQPFGLQPADASRKLTRSESRQARAKFDEMHSEWKDKPYYELPLAETRPYGARHPLELGALIRDFRELNQDVEAWREQTTARVLESSPDANAREAIVRRVEAFGAALRRLFKMQLALISIAPELVEHHPTEADEEVEPALVVLFNRIANAGTSLSNADYVFSLIKHRFPEAHNLVARLHEAGTVASLLSANDVVMTAVRLAANTHTHSGGQPFPDTPVPNPKEFGRLLRLKVDGAGEDDFLRGALLPLIAEDGCKSLQMAFGQLQRLLEYRPEVAGDPGLPRLAFPHLHRQLVQVLVFWIHRRLQANQPMEAVVQELEDSREEVLRFVLAWLLCVHPREKDREAAGKVAFKLLRTQEWKQFPGKPLYDKLCKDELALALQHPDELEKDVISTHQAGTKMYGWHARFWTRMDDGNVVEKYPLYGRWWAHSKHLLLWLQRRTLVIAFKNADPLAGREEETPYDYDHICPQTDWGKDFRSRNNPLKTHCRDEQADVLGNSIGNLRVWDSSMNRSDAGASPAIKLCLDELDSPGTRELLENSAVLMSEALDWNGCSAADAQEGEWELIRALTFQKAVEVRAFRLFKLYFEEGGLDTWLPRSESSSSIGGILKQQSIIPAPSHLSV